MAIYNLSNLSQANTLDEFIVIANIFSEDLLGVMFLVTAFIIVYTVAQTRSDFAMAAATASYVTAIMGFFSVGVGFMSLQMAFIPVILVAAGTGMLFVLRET